MPSAKFAVVKLLNVVTVVATFAKPAVLAKSAKNANKEVLDVVAADTVPAINLVPFHCRIPEF